MTDEQYAEEEAKSRKIDRDEGAQTGMRWTLLAREALVDAVEKVKPVTGAEGLDPHRNMWLGVEAEFDKVMTAKLADAGIAYRKRSGLACYEAWGSQTQWSAPTVVTGNPRVNPPEFNRKFELWQRYHRVRGDVEKLVRGGSGGFGARYERGGDGSGGAAAIQQRKDAAKSALKKTRPADAAARADGGGGGAGAGAVAGAGAGAGVGAGAGAGTAAMAAGNFFLAGTAKGAAPTLSPSLELETSKDRVRGGLDKQRGHPPKAKRIDAMLEALAASATEGATETENTLRATADKQKTVARDAAKSAIEYARDFDMLEGDALSKKRSEIKADTDAKIAAIDAELAAKLTELRDKDTAAVAKKKARLREQGFDSE
jgi:hypothetical protein